MSWEIVMVIAGVIGTIAFAVSGALVAIENKLDLFGVIILGCVTACGGGLFRDLILNINSNMFEEPWYCGIAALVSVLVFVVMYFWKSLSFEDSKGYQIFYNVIDSIGLGAFVVTGALTSINAGATDIFPVVFFAVLTACGGGLLRDMMVMKIPAIFRKHIYAVASIVGGLYFYFLNYLNVSYGITSTTTVILVVIIRYLAFHFKLSLPKVSIKE